jgi:hypothetical protein
MGQVLRPAEINYWIVSRRTHRFPLIGSMLEGEHQHGRLMLMLQLA